MLLADKLRITPFFRVALPFCAGIVVSEWVTAPLGLIVLVLSAVYLTAWMVKDPFTAGAYTYSALFLTGLLLSLVTLRTREIPQGERVVLIAEIVFPPVTAGRWQRATAEAGFYKPTAPRQYTKTATGDPNRSPAPGNEPTWHKVGERILLYLDTCYSASLGEQLTLVSYLNPVDTADSRYGALMRSRGIHSRTYVGPGRLVAKMEAPVRTPAYYSGKMQLWATDRIARLDACDESRQMCAALVAGYRQGIDPVLNNAYSLTGTAHILSVSGLHMGFVFLMANLLLGWVVIFRRGHILKNILVILFLWVYVMMAGMGPTVIRAALMSSALQVALGTSSRGNSYNIVFGAAILMLAVNPYYLYDISFQLSFAAVLSILFLYPRLYRRRPREHRITGIIRSSVWLGVAAQIGVMPLVAYNFGNVPLASFLVNPVVVLTAFLIVCTGLCWLMLGIIPGISGLLNPVTGFVVDQAVWCQNSLVKWSAGLPGAGLSGISVPVWAVWLSYMVFLLTALYIKIREERRIFHKKFSAQL